LWARADHEGRVTRVAAQAAKRTSLRKAAAEGPEPNRSKVPTDSPAVAQLPKAEQIAARNKETARMKADLLGQPHAPTVDADLQEASSAPDWMRLEDEERQRNLALIRKHRNRR
jgi:putative transposase